MRSLFLTLFVRITLGVALFVALETYAPGLRGAPGFCLALAVAALLAWWTTVSLRRAILPLGRSAMSILKADGAQAVGSPAFTDFDLLAQSLAVASGQVREALAASAESRHNLEALLDSMQDAVVAVDAGGRILWSNQRMQRLMSNATASPSSPLRIGHALVQSIRDPDVLQTVEIALDQRTVSQRRATSVLPGSIFEVNTSPMPNGGAVAVLHDITRIEQVERTQQDFVANVSHELRTPLTSISGYVETLLDHEQSLSPTARSFLTTILKNATRMHRLTEDLLALARVESSEEPLTPTPLRSDMLIRDAVQGLSGLVQENEATLEIGSMTTDQVFADHDAVLQVLGNLIENAIKYGQPRNGGRSHVIVSARTVQEPVPAVEFSVRDFGQGIASEHLTRIFERFYRVDKARSRESGGTGLGLAIARHMIQTQGGAIWAESNLNEGSTFLFTLPLALYPVQEEQQR
jgi:two-component system phosphate regulon sensor histidine kinase PhoR